MAATKTPTRQERCWCGRGGVGAPAPWRGECETGTAMSGSTPESIESRVSQRQLPARVHSSSKQPEHPRTEECTTRCSVRMQWTVIQHGSTLRLWCSHWRTNTVGSTYLRSLGDTGKQRREPGGKGGGGQCVMGRVFQLEKIRKFWRWVVAMIAQQSRYIRCC